MEKSTLPRPSPFSYAARFLFENFIRPKSSTEDDQRHEFILNIILLASLVLAAVCTAIVVLNSSSPTTLLIAVSVLCIFAILLLASRLGYFRASAHVLVFVYTLPMLFMTFVLGIDLPQILLSYALLIVMSSVLLNTRFSLIYTTIITIFLGGLAYAHWQTWWSPDQSWRAEPFIAYDVVAFVVTFGAIATVSWLSNREIEKSLVRARRSEAELKLERDSLEIKVTERTDELRRAQAAQIAQLHRFVEFGRLASGLFHDLASPLTAVALNLESLKDDSSQADRARTHLEQALKATKGLENFIGAARKQLQSQEIQTNFDIVEEIREVISVLGHKAKKAGVEVDSQLPASQPFFGNPLKFGQVISNLLSNAIDAYATVPNKSKRTPIIVAVVDKMEHVSVSVTDGGCGMTAEQQARVFEPFFTTKGIEAGMGIGLSSTKNIVEKDFHGSITFTSVAGKGTSFTVRLPHAVAPAAARTK